MPGGRPTNESKSEKMYLKEQFQAINQNLNALEEICKSPNIVQKEDMVGSIGLQVGKLLVRITNIEERLRLFDDDE